MSIASTNTEKNSNSLALLACPTCHGPLQILSAPEQKIFCTSCSLTYPIIDGIPVLIRERATQSIR